MGNFDQCWACTRGGQRTDTEQLNVTGAMYVADRAIYYDHVCDFQNFMRRELRFEVHGFQMSNQFTRSGVLGLN